MACAVVDPCSVAKGVDKVGRQLDAGQLESVGQDGLDEAVGVGLQRVEPVAVSWVAIPSLHVNWRNHVYVGV